MSISRREVEHTARLAHLELTEAGIEAMTRDLGAVLDLAARIAAVDTGGVDPDGAAPAAGAPAREDGEEPGLAPGTATAGAPEAAAGLFKVPPAFGGA